MWSLFRRLDWKSRDLRYFYRIISPESTGEILLKLLAICLF